MTEDDSRSPRPLDDLPRSQLGALLAAAPNFRDAGGFMTPAGRRMRPGVLYRTGQLVDLSPEAETALTSLGISAVYDLRTEGEREPKPDNLPAEIALVCADVLADAPESGATAVATLGGKAGNVSISQVNEMIGGGKAIALMRDTYRDFVRLPSAHAAYRSVLRGVAGGEGAVAFHCTAGKDRTGWGAAIMQLFAGVDPSTVMTDYLASSERTLAQYQPALEGFERAGGDADALRHLVDVYPEYLETAIDLMTSTYGDLEGYLVEGVGLSRVDLAALESRLIA